MFAFGESASRRNAGGFAKVCAVGGTSGPESRDAHRRRVGDKWETGGLR